MAGSQEGCIPAGICVCCKRTSDDEKMRAVCKVMAEVPVGVFQQIVRTAKLEL